MPSCRQLQNFLYIGITDLGLKVLAQIRTQELEEGMHAAALENFIAPHRCEELFTVSEMGIVGNQTGGSRQKGGHAADGDMSLVVSVPSRSGQGFAHVGQTDGIVLVDQGLTLQNLQGWWRSC